MSIEFNDVFDNLNRIVIIRYFDTLISGIFESLEVYQTLYNEHCSNPSFVMFEVHDIIQDNNSFNKMQKKMLLSKNMITSGYFEVIGYVDELSDRDIKRIKMENKLRRGK